jgi:hypothetical protein
VEIEKLPNACVREMQTKDWWSSKSQLYQVGRKKKAIGGNGVEPLVMMLSWLMWEEAEEEIEFVYGLHFCILAK